jgi:hypothetical protein
VDGRAKPGQGDRGLCRGWCFTALSFSNGDDRR